MSQKLDKKRYSVPAENIGLKERSSVKQDTNDGDYYDIETNERYSKTNFKQMRRDIRKENMKKTLSMIKQKLQALGWTLFSLFLIFSLNLFNYYLACAPAVCTAMVGVCVGILSMIVLYGGIYLPMIKKQRRDIEVTHPQLIFVASSLIFAVIIFLIIGFWPSFSFYSIPFVMIVALGYMMSMHFFPKNIVGTILFFAFHVGIFLLQMHYYSQPISNQCSPGGWNIFKWQIVGLKNASIPDLKP